MDVSTAAEDSNWSREEKFLAALPTMNDPAWSRTRLPIQVSGCSVATLQPRVLELPAVTPLHPTLEAAILAPPLALDKPGALYVFDIPADQPNHRTRRALARAQIRMAKIRRSKHPWKRRAQWVWKCRGQQQDWWAYCNVPYAVKFEALIHLHFKLLGAWMLPSECHFCGVQHTENLAFTLVGVGLELLHNILSKALFEKFGQIEQTNLIYCVNVHTKKIQNKNLQNTRLQRGHGTARNLFKGFEPKSRDKVKNLENEPQASKSFEVIDATLTLPVHHICPDSGSARRVKGLDDCRRCVPRRPEA
ncbi:hypothetical protein B0H17DRAFT_1125076 [Mycena rosella]|uniref:Uncharacterized protein n=1 Tax=Mycena rosella TaxID=1033263 RepID=A0AAD7GYU2_MYCRO|nr:hypothetical protein B0H17DRAFT_1125076 [Mycena rosella]